MHLDKLRIRRHFGRSAKSYDRVASMQREIIEELSSYARNQSELTVDLGCGTGYALGVLRHQLGNTPLGVDLAAEMLHSCRLSYPNAELVQADIEKLPFADGQFGLVFSASALQWCDLTCALSEIARVTRPGGQVLISTFINGTLSNWHQWWQLAAPKPFVTTDDLRRGSSDAGLKLIRLSCKTYTQQFTSFDGALASIRELGAGGLRQTHHRGLLGKGQFQSVRFQIDREIAEHGHIELSYKVAFVEARRRLA